MLAYILAIAVGLGSFALYMSAFFFPEVHRKYDFTWSGVGMFYALVLWVCAGRITGGVLLGQFASVALLGWFGWQTLSLRRELTPQNLRTQPTAQPIWKTPLHLSKTSLPTESQPVSLFSGLASISGRLTELASNTRALIKGLWQTSSKPVQKPPEPPPRPTIVRSPLSEAEKAAKAEARAKAREARLAERAREKEKAASTAAQRGTHETQPTEEGQIAPEGVAAQGVEVVNVAQPTEEAIALQTADQEIGDPNLANPNNSLELLDDDFLTEDQGGDTFETNGSAAKADMASLEPDLAEITEPLLPTEADSTELISEQLESEPELISEAISPVGDGEANASPENGEANPVEELPPTSEDASLVADPTEPTQPL
ncbi:Ycf66 family protein [Oscillatoria sp. FACHB-1407]|uniref:Ycf66 family protein n=1 Tax=Oscillatoria sp. FACHB-1407 TaxID=2692847 RepID=UPI0018F03DFD|nr:Ycf66 family protein [Oscillatoria sp. FACHB-1407]